MSRRDLLIVTFVQAGEALAHYLADANAVEAAWALRGFIETVDGPTTCSGDAGEYGRNYRHGSLAAMRLGLDEL
jgi:hypothetical protein